MDPIIKIGAQILFALACFVFVLYSIVGMYALNTDGIMDGAYVINRKSITR